MSSFSAVNPAEMQSSVNKVLQGLNISDLLKIGGRRLRPEAVGAFGGKIWKLIQDAIAGIDLSKMTKEEFLEKVDHLYDTMIAPSIEDIAPVIGPMLSAALNQVILNIAGKFYDNHSGPKPTPAPTASVE